MGSSGSCYIPPTAASAALLLLAAAATAAARTLEEFAIAAEAEAAGHPCCDGAALDVLVVVLALVGVGALCVHVSFHAVEAKLEVAVTGQQHVHQQNVHEGSEACAGIVTMCPCSAFMVSKLEAAVATGCLRQLAQCYDVEAIIEVAAVVGDRSTSL